MTTIAPLGEATVFLSFLFQRIAQTLHHLLSLF